LPRHRSPRRRRGSPPPPLNQGQRPGPSTLAAAASRSSTSDSSKCTRMATPSAATRLRTPTPLEETLRRPLVFRLRRRGCTAFGIRVIPDVNSTVTATPGDVGFGHQASPSTAPPSFADINATAARPSFIIGTMAARRGAPPFYDAGGPSTAAPTEASATASPAPASPPSASAPPRPTPPCQPGISCGTWSPAALGLSSGN
jgi:hypothetical protein